MTQDNTLRMESGVGVETGPSPCRRLHAEVLTAQEIQVLLDACGSATPAGVRNRALIAVLYRGGLRINEALCLLPKDVDLDTGAGSIFRRSQQLTVWL